MIAVDVNAVVYLVVQGEHTETAEQWLARDRHWLAPPLLRSELRNVLVGCVRRGQFSFDFGLAAYQRAVALLQFTDEPDAAAVLRIATAEGLSAYDAEYVALARHLGVQLLTNDRRIIAACKDVAQDFQQPPAAAR